MAELLFHAVCAGKKVIEMVENTKECEESAFQIADRCDGSDLRIFNSLSP